MARFPGTWGIFSSPGDSKLISVALLFSEIDTVIFLSFELVGRNRAPLHFKTATIADPRFSNRDFDQLRIDIPELGGYLPVLGTLN